MFCVVDKERNFTPVKSGFHTAAQANDWAKKNLPKGEVQLWGAGWDYTKQFRYFVRMK